MTGAIAVGSGVILGLVLNLVISELRRIRMLLIEIRDQQR